MTDPTLFQRVRLAREGAAVERCHAHPHLMRYSVGHHTCDLLTLLTLCWQSDHNGQLPSAGLLVVASFHDVVERITGDLPSVTKHHTPWADVVEDRALTRLGVGVEITDEERDYLNAADSMEVWFWAREELARGNRAFVGWVDYYDNRWGGDDPAHWLPHAMNELWRQACMAGNGRMGMKEEREWAGDSPPSEGKQTEEAE